MPGSSAASENASHQPGSVCLPSTHRSGWRAARPGATIPAVLCIAVTTACTPCWISAARAGGLDGRIESEKIGLFGDRPNVCCNRTDLLGTSPQRLDPLFGLTNSVGRTPHLASNLLRQHRSVLSPAYTLRGHSVRFGGALGQAANAYGHLLNRGDNTRHGSALLLGASVPGFGARDLAGAPGRPDPRSRRGDRDAPRFPPPRPRGLWRHHETLRNRPEISTHAIP